MLNWIEGKQQEYYALLRIVTGFLLFCHVTGNFLDLPIANPHTPPEWVLISAGAIYTRITSIGDSMTIHDIDIASEVLAQPQKNITQ